MNYRIILFATLFLICTTATGQYGQYSYKRALNPGDGQWQQLVLPEDIFSKISPAFSDIRIVCVKENKDTVEAPYVLLSASGKKMQNDIPFKLINRSKNEKGYYYSFEVQGGPQLNQVDLEFKQQNFDWKLSLEGSHDLQQWFTIIDDYRVLSIQNAQTSFTFTKVAFPASRYTYYRLFITASTDPELLKATLSQTELTEANWINYPAQSVSIENKKATRQTIIHVTQSQAVPHSWIKIFVKNNYDYYRQASIEYVSDSVKTETGWHYNYQQLASGILNSLEQNEFLFNSTILKKLRITIDNHDNEPLQIDSVQVRGYEHIIKARFADKGRYWLLYGNKNAVAPHYDIENFRNRIPAAMPDLQVGEEEITRPQDHKPASIFQDKIWLWLIMAAIIILLGWFTLNMMKQASDDKTHAG